MVVGTNLLKGFNNLTTEAELKKLQKQERNKRYYQKKKGHIPLENDTSYFRGDGQFAKLYPDAPGIALEIWEAYFLPYAKIPGKIDHIMEALEVLSSRYFQGIENTELEKAYAKELAS